MKVSTRSLTLEEHSFQKIFQHDASIKFQKNPRFEKWLYFKELSNFQLVFVHENPFGFLI